MNPGRPLAKYCQPFRAHSSKSILGKIRAPVLSRFPASPPDLSRQIRKKKVFSIFSTTKHQKIKRHNKGSEWTFKWATSYQLRFQELHQIQLRSIHYNVRNNDMTIIYRIDGKQIKEIIYSCLHLMLKLFSPRNKCRSFNSVI